MSAPFRLTQIAHVVLRVRDLDAALHFYRDILGCTLDKVQEKIGLWQVRAGSSLIDLIPLDGVLGKLGGAAPGTEGHNLDHFALQLDRIAAAALRAHLRAHDITIVDSGQRYGYECYCTEIYIRDPDGNTVELKGPPEG